MHSRNAAVAYNLIVLCRHFCHQAYLDNSDMVTPVIVGRLLIYPEHHAQRLELLILRTSRFYEVAIVGPDFNRIKTEMESNIPPNCILLGGGKHQSLKLLENKFSPDITRIFVCENKMCKIPVTEVEQALDQLVP